MSGLLLPLLLHPIVVAPTIQVDVTSLTTFDISQGYLTSTKPLVIDLNTAE
jgi:hypothetical protein